ncbi:hypothetical protein SAMN02745163_00859 [Clostridium cavendishii DSM 21758]|uniref:Uncharacterized protein n=1 Tax=Clostridium cavendishii DSM 21758 TaxID=1121302 RepID=A0A1M6EIP7_9CLOT|nr:hypothetical protein [Clostridium cavendishii]SHI85148.1 hypothetical protein SAMN02745163_00859 [Clostridium cavendishii DSM 21758]
MAKKSLLKNTPDYEDYTENIVIIDENIIKELGIMAGEYIVKKGCCSSGGGCSSGCAKGNCSSCSKKDTNTCCKNK